MEITCVTVDCSDPERVASFWNEAKNRVHLGCSAGTLTELEDTVERLRGLGATIASEETFPAEINTLYRNVVLRDVEGNEFCLSGGQLPD